MTLSYSYSWLRAVFSLAILLTAVSLANCQAILIDDFSDGDDEGWTHIDEWAVGAGPGIFDVSNGVYHLQTENAVAPHAGEGVSSLWEASNELSLQNAYNQGEYSE